MKFKFICFDGTIQSLSWHSQLQGFKFKKEYMLFCSYVVLIMNNWSKGVAKGHHNCWKFQNEPGTLDRWKHLRSIIECSIKYICTAFHFLMPLINEELHFQDSNTKSQDIVEVELFACPVCYEPLIRKGPPGFNL